MIDDQQSGTNTKQGLTPSPSNAFSPVNTNAVDSTNGMKFLMVPGQSAQMGSFSSGKHVRCARYTYIKDLVNVFSLKLTSCLGKIEIDCVVCARNVNTIFTKLNFLLCFFLPF